MAKRAHPAHRMSQYGPKEPEQHAPYEGCDILELMQEMASTATTEETPGVHRDDLGDQIIMLARQWIEREERSNKWIKELS